MSTTIVIAQFVSGVWVIGRLETKNGFVDEAVQEQLSGEGHITLITPLEIHVQPMPGGKAQVMMVPCGFPVIQYDATKEIPMAFPAHAFMRYPDEAPQQYADSYRQSTSSIQIAPAGAVPGVAGHPRR